MDSQKEEIFNLFKQKSCTKQDVYASTKEVFNELLGILKEFSSEFKEQIAELDDRVKVELNAEGPFDARLTFGGDDLIFHMHSNIFSFPKEHFVWKTGYLKEDEMRSYCGIINVYNFLADSFRYNRENDLGYMVCRIFINKERHYFVEGKGGIGVQHNDFINSKIDKDQLKSIIEASVLYSLKFDLLTPPYQKVQLVSLDKMRALSNNHKLKTGKRLGFKFSWENEEMK